MSVLFLQFDSSALYGQDAAPNRVDNSNCIQKIDKAEKLYYSGKFNKSVNIIKECLKDNSFNQEGKLKAYTILANIFLVKNNKPKSKEIINKIFELQPEYQPTIEQYKPEYVKLVEEVRMERATVQTGKGESGWSNWWLYGAGTAVAVGAILYFMQDADDNPSASEVLSEPPGFPEQQ